MLNKILATPTEQLGKAGRFVVFQIKLWSHCVRLLKKNRSTQQAAALSYHTIFGIVPLAVVTLLIFQSFPAYSNIGENVKSFVYEQLNLTNIKFPHPAEPERTIMVTDHLDSIIERIFDGLSGGTIALVSAVIIIWAALALLSTIERAFNNIWHVGKGRSFLQRMINYWALLTLGPLLLGVGIYIATRYTAVGQIQQSILAHIAPAVLSYIVAVVGFFLLYFVLPNSKVQAKSAIWGAAVAGLVWSFAKWGFGLYVIKLVPYGKIYGVLGLIPLSVFWIYITWLIVLFGLQLTFTTQHLKTLDAAEIAAAEKTEEYFIANDTTVINIAREIAAAFETNKAPIESEVLCSKLNIPPQFGERILGHLVRHGIIVKSSEPKVGFMPAKEPACISLSDIADAVSAAAFAQWPAELPNSLKQITQSQRSAFSQYNLKQILRDQ